MIVLGNCKRLFGVDAKMIGWGKCYVETEDWTTARECNKDIVCGEGAFVRRETSCPKGTCQSEGDCDGRLVWDTERALQSPEGQGQDEVDRNPLHLLRRPHGKRGSVGGQDREQGARLVAA